MNATIRSTGTRELAVALFTLASTACSTTGSTTRTEETRDLIDLPVVERAIHVALPSGGIDDNSLRDQYRTHGRRAIGHIRARCTTQPAPGSTCSEVVDVRITAVEGAKYIDPANTPPNNPQLLAWVENLGDKQTYDGFKPASQFVYALVVDAAPAGDRVNRPVIYAVGFSTDPNRRREITQAVYGHVYPCHSYPRPLFSEADFLGCPWHDISLANRAEKQPSGVVVTGLPTRSLLSTADASLWFPCNPGCCTSSNTVLAPQH